MSVSYRVAIMQPYFLPYIGYWQLMSCVDCFVVYDDIQFTKKGWIHRNRYLNGGADHTFTLPLKKDSDYLDIRERTLADSWSDDKKKIRRKIEGAYRKAPNFNEGMGLFDECLNCYEGNLFSFLLNSLCVVKSRLGILSELRVSSELGDTSSLIGQDRVIDICKKVGAGEYVNLTGGRQLYNADAFASQGIRLKFHEVGEVKYEQMGGEFLRNLSILDMFMFIGAEGVKEQLTNFELRT